MLISSLVRTAAMVLGSIVFLGCAADRGGNVPPGAVLAASGNGEINYRAPHDGMIYVYDKNRDQLVWSGQIHRGETFTLDHDQDCLKIDDRVVQDKTPGIDNEHRIFLGSSDADHSLDARNRY